MRPCRDCAYFFQNGILEKKDDVCCISVVTNILRRDSPDAFKAETRFPPPLARFVEWGEKDQGCSFFKSRIDAGAMYDA